MEIDMMFCTLIPPAKCDYACKWDEFSSPVCSRGEDCEYSSNADSCGKYLRFSYDAR